MRWRELATARPALRCVAIHDGATISRGPAQTTGGRWIPNFDPSKIVSNAWGTLTFTFADCDTANVDFASASGYDSGNMDLTRFTQPAGVVCP